MIVSFGAEARLCCLSVLALGLLVLLCVAVNEMQWAIQRADHWEESFRAVAEKGHSFWLVMAIPTVRRPTDPRYLSVTVLSLLEQLPSSPTHPLFCSVAVIVINNNVPMEEHTEFYMLRDSLARHPLALSRCLRFIEGLNSTTAPPTVPAAAYHPVSSFLSRLPASLPVFFVPTPVRRHVALQTRDVVHLGRTCLNTLSFKYFMFLEDDFVWCPSAFLALQHYMQKADDYFGRRWSALRVSYGLNGLVVPQHLLPDLLEYLYSRATYKPPDLNAYAFLSNHRARHGPIAACRFNLFRHIGAVSSIKGVQRYSPECYQLLNDWLQPGEQFDFEACPDDDLSPCPKGPPSTLIDWDADIKAMCRRHFPVCQMGGLTEAQAAEQRCRIVVRGAAPARVP